MGGWGRSRIYCDRGFECSLGVGYVGWAVRKGFTFLMSMSLNSVIDKVICAGATVFLGCSCTFVWLEVRGSFSGRVSGKVKFIVSFGLALGFGVVTVGG